MLFFLGRHADHRGVHHEFFLGSGGVLGLLSALTGQPMSGAGPAVAEANAMHKGPLIFHLPQVYGCRSAHLHRSARLQAAQSSVWRVQKKLQLGVWVVCCVGACILSVLKALLACC